MFMTFLDEVGEDLAQSQRTAFRLEPAWPAALWSAMWHPREAASVNAYSNWIVAYTQSGYFMLGASSVIYRTKGRDEDH
jgi:hypothetical protein